MGRIDEVLASATQSHADLDGTMLVAETELDYDELGRLTGIAHERADQIFARYNLTWADEEFRTPFRLPPGSKVLVGQAVPDGTSSSLSSSFSISSVPVPPR
jgi:hypothetical protein